MVIKMKKIRILCLSVVFAVVLTIIAGNFPAFADTLEDNVFFTNEVVSALNLPHNMRAAIIKPETDFILTENDTETEIIFQLDNIFSEFNDIGFNTVIIAASAGGKAYYNLDMNSGISDRNDYIAAAIEKARQFGLNVYLIYDINPVINTSANQSDAINKLISEIHRFTLKYDCDGIILDNYYGEDTTESFRNYMECGSGIGFNNWLYDKTEYFIKTASSVIRFTNGTIPVGLMINDMWANKSSNEQGSPTSDSFEAYYGGFSDTRGFVQKGYADFIMLRSYGSTENDAALPFTETANWWGELCKENDVSMYLIHYNEKVGNPVYGWGEDQILRQLITAKEEIPAYGGSIFNSYQALKENKLNSTGTIKLYYSHQINEEKVFEDLTMHSPQSLNFTTTEPIAVFAGTFDPNFDVYLNDSKIKLNAAGNFYFEEELNVGVNTFTLSHKSKTYTYRIEKKIVTLREINSSIANGKTLNVEGGTKISIEAVAYKGSNVTASINGQTITLKENSATLNDSDPNSSYASFTGTYKVPDGIIETEQPLGTINISATYKGSYSMTAICASVTVKAKEKPPEVSISYDMYDESTIGTFEVVGVISATHSEDKIYKYVKINKDYTQIYEAKTTGSVINPDFGQLPAGTIDYFSSDVGGFYTTDSGKRFKAADVTVFEDYGIGENNLIVKSLGTSNGKSFLEIGLDFKTSYNVETVGNNYFSNWGTDYNITGFNAKYVYITFDNVTSVTKLPSFDTNLVFSAGSWEQVSIDGIPKFRLVLTLRQPGVYAGNGAYYNDSGNLMLTFNVLQNSLAGLTVVIDPGHGYIKDMNSFDPGAIGHVVEQEVNLGVAIELTKQLQALGANVIRYKTESQLYLTAERAPLARSYNCDIFISLHSNSVAQDSSVRGTEAYYFTPFSEPLAAAVSKNISKYFTNNVYNDGADKNRGAKFQLFWVTLQQDFPSILVEMGFVTSMDDAMALADTEHQKGIAKGIVAGISEYISRSSINYGGGTSTVSISDSSGNDSYIDETTDYDTDTDGTDTDFGEDNYNEDNFNEADFDEDDFDEIEDAV